MKPDNTNPVDQPERPRSSFFQSIGAALGEGGDHRAAADTDWDVVQPGAGDTDAGAEDEFDTDADFDGDDAGVYADGGTYDDGYDDDYGDADAAPEDELYSGAGSRAPRTNRHTRRTRHGRGTARRNPPAAGRVSTAPTALGWVALVAAAAGSAVAVAAPEAGLLQTLAGLGLTPASLLLVGVLLVLHGAVQARAARTAAATDQRVDDLEARLAGLAELPRNTDSGDPTDVQDHLQRTLLALERQDEKLGNLTRATKMYGKPLIEISKQLDTLTNQVTDLDTIGARLETLTRQIGTLTKQVDALDVGGLDDASAERLAEVLAAAKRTVHTTEQLGGRLEEALSQTLGDTVTGKLDADRRNTTAALAKLEETLAMTLGDTVAGKLDADRRSTTAALTKLEETLTGTLSETLAERLRKTLADQPAAEPPRVDLGAVERALETVNRDVAGIATQLSRLEATPRAAASAAPAAAAPAPAAPAAAAPQQSAPATPQGGQSGNAAGGLAQKIAGARPGGGNVLGAIAKLRSMKGN